MGIFLFNRAKKQGGEKRENGKGTNTENTKGAQRTRRRNERKAIIAEGGRDAEGA